MVGWHQASYSKGFVVRGLVIWEHVKVTFIQTLRVEFSSQRSYTVFTRTHNKETLKKLFTFYVQGL